MKRRALTLFLCLTLLLSLAIPGTMAFADETGSETPSSGMELNKTAVRNNDGTYTITLEAYATGSKVITTEKKDIPTDIILVLDQSGSMDETFSNVTADSWTSYGKQRNSTNYDRRMNASNGTKNLYYKLPDGDYVEVSVERFTSSASTYEEFNGTNSQCNNSRQDLYVSTEEGYKKLTVSYNYDWNETYTYSYELSSGTVTLTGTGWRGTPPCKVYRMQTSNVYTYEYSYTVNGVKNVIGSRSEGANTVFDTEFYQKATTTTSVTKLSALRSAVSTFVKAVNEKAKGPDGVSGTSDDVNHRIAMVGFASGIRYNGYNYNYSNTEVFVGSKEYRYGTAAQGQYANAFQDMNTSAGVSNINASINALDADGGTLTNLGLEMANGIFGKNPLKTGEQRNRVVIVFTDGIPGWSGYDSSVADSAVSQASTAKTTYGATVYTIGIFAGADATSAGSTDRNSTDADKGNYFLQQVSSNNGTPQTPSYYLSAADAGTLSNIFQQISDQIESGGSSSTLTGEAVVKDIVSEQFSLPDGADASNITLETYACTGKNGDTYTWSKNADVMGAKATVEGDQVSVTGFNFSENYVGTVNENGTVTYRGNKLVIKFNVEEKEGLLGGNAIPTNASAGVYEKSDSANPVISFPQPTVDVPIPNVTVTAEDKNVYLKGTVTAADLQTGATVKVGNVDLDLSKAEDTENPYGLEKWQVAYVDIAVEILDAAGNKVTSDYENLTADTTYTVQVTVSPRNQGTVTEKSGNAKGSINVFTPTLTYKDSEAYYGETAATDFSANKVSEKWMHNGEEAVGSSMIGTKRELNIVYTAETSKLNNNTYTKQDVPVAAQVFIDNEAVNNYTTFEHQACSPECGWVNATESGNPAFKIHIKTCTLNINKQGGADGESYVFTVLKDGQEYSEVTVSGNGTETLVELPVGTYTIEENTGWSWRYTANNGTDATLSAKNPTGDITCTNAKTVNTWLNGFSAVVRNIFGKAN